MACWDDWAPALLRPAVQAFPVEEPLPEHASEIVPPEPLSVAQTELGEASNRNTEAQGYTMWRSRAECTAAMTDQPQVQRQSPDHTHAIRVLDQSGRKPSLFTVPKQSDTRNVENESENAGSDVEYSISGDTTGTSDPAESEGELEQPQSQTGVLTAVSEKCIAVPECPVRCLTNVDRSAEWGANNKKARGRQLWALLLQLGNEKKSARNEEGHGPATPEVSFRRAGCARGKRKFGKFAERFNLSREH